MDIAFKEISSKYDESEYELEKARDKSFKLDRQLEETLIKFNNFQKRNMISNTSANSCVEANQFSIPNIKTDKSSNITEKQV